MQRAYQIDAGLRETWTVFATNAGKARYEAYRSLADAGYDVPLTSIKARSLGLRETPREIAERKRDAFNKRFPVGTPIRVYPGNRDDEESAYDTFVRAPGAFIVGGPRGTQVSVKVPGDSIALTHVVVRELAEGVAR